MSRNRVITLYIIELDHYVETDTEKRKVLEAKNDAEPIIKATKRSLEAMKSKLSEQEISQIQNQLKTLEAAIIENNLIKIKNAHKDLNNITQHLAELLISNTLSNNLNNLKAKDILNK